MSVRVRFAPSPTGALHIGGVRTALYNLLFARKNKGTFILRIEDTDQNRLVEGAEQYIMDSLKWLNLTPDESPVSPGNHGPYRQSERLDIYREHASQLIASGKAYYAFDTPDSLDAARKAAEEAGGAFLYSAANRMSMKNSLNMSSEEVQNNLANGVHYVIRLLVNPDETIAFNDLIRGDVHFSSNELDDKILMKSDGFPTYHLANVVDDRLMEISHVIRGEEWLSSTAHHILLYRAFGWQDNMPSFAHLPLILKPSGNGKLSKRDGDKLGIPVFPITWNHDTLGHFNGFREAGYLPDAVLNFLALLGWSPGDNIELMDRNEMIQHFSIEKIGKSGSRFDIDKARWFNQHYIISSNPADLALLIDQPFRNAGYNTTKEALIEIIRLFQERVDNLNDFVPSAYFLFNEPNQWDSDKIIKKWNDNSALLFSELMNVIQNIQTFNRHTIESEVEQFILLKEINHGAIFPALRVALTGMTKGPELFPVMEILGKERSLSRMQNAFTHFNSKKL